MTNENKTIEITNTLLISYQLTAKYPTTATSLASLALLRASSPDNGVVGGPVFFLSQLTISAD